MKHKRIPQRPSSEERRIAEEETQPLPVIKGLVFRAFLAHYELSLLDVAMAAGVRLLTVWNVERDNPISRQHAEMVRAGLYRLTGIYYSARIILRQEQPEPGAQAHFAPGQAEDQLRKAWFLS